jgi:hypothetical protein
MQAQNKNTKLAIKARVRCLKQAVKRITEFIFQSQKQNNTTELKNLLIKKENRRQRKQIVWKKRKRSRRKNKREHKKEGHVRSDRSSGSFSNKLGVTTNPHQKQKP